MQNRAAPLGKAAGHRGCSPRVRGWSRLPGRAVPRFPVFPACAGVVPGQRGLRLPAHSVPRVCGDGPWPEQVPTSGPACFPAGTALRHSLPPRLGSGLP
ncbi:hypothetical protein C0L86_24220 [Streptomyces sp. SCA2-2]|nr:hypothetical protein C0L86_24220 [Streptomyces sp. SCA2-2]